MSKTFNWCIKVKDNKVDHPLHYYGRGMEAIDVIEAFDLGFNLGNAIKYILRSERKGDPKTDIEKAIWYLTRELETRTYGWVYREKDSSEETQEAVPDNVLHIQQD